MRVSKSDMKSPRSQETNDGVALIRIQIPEKLFTNLMVCAFMVRSLVLFRSRLRVPGRNGKSEQGVPNPCPPSESSTHWAIMLLS